MNTNHLKTDSNDFEIGTAPTQRVELILEAVLAAMMGGCCGTRRGSRGRWRKPLRILVQGKGPEDGSVRRQPSVAGVG